MPDWPLIQLATVKLPTGHKLLRQRRKTICGSTRRQDSDLRPLGPHAIGKLSTCLACQFMSSSIRCKQEYALIPRFALIDRCGGRIEHRPLYKTLFLLFTTPDQLCHRRLFRAQLAGVIVRHHETLPAAGVRDRGHIKAGLDQVRLSVRFVHKPAIVPVSGRK